MRCFRLPITLLLVFVAFLQARSSANAGLLIPNGNPTGASSKTSNDGQHSVVLNPTAAALNGLANPNLMDALGSSCGISTDNGWTINMRNLQGNFSLGTYEAYADNVPAFSQGGMSYAGGLETGSGGAAFGLRYTRGGTDPAQTSLYWIQLVGTNWPIAAPSPQPSVSWFIDVKAGATSPYYPVQTQSNLHSDLIDESTRGYNLATIWGATDFIAWGLDTNAKVIYIGNQNVSWGFSDPTPTVPEPATIALALIGGFALTFLRLPRKRRLA